jgi:hypothetical protein
MKATYVWLSRLIAIAVVLQAMWIAFGMFDVLKSASDGRAFTEDSDFNTGQALHSVFGLMVIPLLAVILLIVSFFAKVPGGVKWAGIVFGLTVLQVLLGFVSFAAPVLGLLHGLNAFALAAAAGLAGRGTRKAVTPEPTSPYGPGVAEA